MCRRRDSNSHTLRYTILSRARLPFRHSGIVVFNLMFISTPPLTLPSLVLRLLATDVFAAKLLDPVFVISILAHD